MRHERQIERLGRPKGLDPTEARERVAPFLRRPQLIGLSCEISEPGASLTASLDGRNLDLSLNVKTTEDFPLTARIHGRLAAGAIDELVYGRNESAFILLHQPINAALG